MTPRLPPTVSGLPLLGNAPEFRRNPVALIRRGYETHGPVFSIRLGPMRGAVLIGPDYHRLFFAETGRALGMAEVYKAFVPIFGKGFTLAAAGPEYEEQRRILRPAFTHEKMPGYVRVMFEEATAWLARLGREGEFDLCETLEELALNTVARALLGDDFRRRMGPEFFRLYRDVVRGIDVLLPPYLPLPRFIRRDRARRTIQRRIRALIAERRGRRPPPAASDFFQELATATYSGGAPVADTTLESMIMFLVFSASESSPIQASWTLIELLRHPSYLGRVLDELEAGPDAEGDEDLEAGLGQLTQLEWAIKESERLRPMTTSLWRLVKDPLRVGDFVIPRGWLAIICPAVAHRLPEVFPDPDAYAPDRFGPGRAEDHRTPHGLVTFGGGYHRCPGVRFAYNWIKVALGLLLRHYSLDLVDRDPQPDYSTSIGRPPSPCPVRYRSRRTLPGGSRSCRPGPLVVVE